MKISLFRGPSDEETWVDVVQFFSEVVLVIACALLMLTVPAMRSWLDVRLLWIERIYRINFVYGGISSFSLAAPVLALAFFIATKKLSGYVAVSLFLLLSGTAIYLYIYALCKV